MKINTDSIATLQAARRYLTTVLLNLPISTTETSVANLLTLIDHFICNPDDYTELVRTKHNDSRLGPS